MIQTAILIILLAIVYLQALSDAVRETDKGKSKQIDNLMQKIK